MRLFNNSLVLLSGLALMGCQSPTYLDPDDLASGIHREKGVLFQTSGAIVAKGKLVVGTLSVTTQRLRFQPHDSDESAIEIMLTEVIDVQFLALPVYSGRVDGIMVRVRSGQEYRFMVAGSADRLVEVLREQVERLKAKRAKNRCRQRL